MDEVRGKQRPKQAAGEAAVSSAAKTVLVVDDDSGVRQLYSTFLLRRGFDVVAVRTGREALAKVKELTICGAILDLALPDDSGYNLCRKLRRFEGARDAFVVMISGTHALSEEKAIAAGADAIVKKPFSTMDLARILCAGIAAREVGKPTKRDIQKSRTVGR